MTLTLSLEDSSIMTSFIESERLKPESSRLKKIQKFFFAYNIPKILAKSYFQNIPLLGFEPGSPAWQPAMLSFTPPRPYDER